MSRFLLLNFEDFSLNQDITKTIQPFNPFCICCLDRDGPMIDLVKCDHSDYLDAFDKPELKEFNQIVCFHCHNILKKIKCFQAQVVESYGILQSGEFTNTTVNNKKPSSLIIQKVVDDLHLPPDISDSVDIEENNQDELRNEQNFSHIMGEVVQNNSNIEQNYTYNMEEEVQSDSNMEPFINIEENLVQEQNTLNKNIKTALEILERNSQSFISLSSQLQFLNGEHLSFLKPSLLSKEILTDIPVVTAKSSSTDMENGLLNNSKPLEIEIDGTDKMFFDSLDLSPELMGKETHAEMMEDIVSDTKKEINKEIQPKTKCSTTKPIKDGKTQKLNSRIQYFRNVKLTHEDLDRERVKQAQSDAYLKYKYRCETCIIGFNYIENLEDHVKRKHGPREGDGIICEICSQTIPNAGRITEHNYRHYTRYECLRCSKRCHTHEEALQHYAKHQCINNPGRKRALKNKPTVQLKRAKLKMKPAKD